MGNSLQAIREKATHTDTQETDQETEQHQTQFTCEICDERTSVTRKFRNKDLCTHPYCQDCVSKYIQVKILQHTAKIPCPDSNCKQNLDPVSNVSMISKPLFVKWCDLLCENFVLRLEKCYCPNRECMEMVVNECHRHGTVKKSKCPNCKQDFCFDCKMKWHANFSCKENETMAEDRNDFLLRNLIERKKWKNCPACGHCVELRAGCAFVKCRCKTLFCYDCGEKVSGYTCRHCRGSQRRGAEGPLVMIFGLFVFFFFVGNRH